MKAREKRRLESRFPPSLFGLYLVSLLFMSGVHTGFIALINAYEWNNTIQIIVPVIYWSLLAAGLTRLQRNFDSCVSELKALERDKTMLATIAALAAGVLGTAFMAGATFAVVAEPPVLWLTVLLAIPGFPGWIVPYFLYQILVRKRTAEIEPLIEQKYDEIHSICEKVYLKRSF